MLTAIQAEAIRGRAGLPPRAHVILPVEGGFRVFAVATERAASPVYRSRGRALEAYSAVEAGLILAVGA